MLLAMPVVLPYFTPNKAHRDVERSRGNAVKDLFGVTASGLTADEAALRNFRNPDELRARFAKARDARSERLGAKGFHEDPNPIARVEHGGPVRL
jgi:hypothetical protein